MSVTSEERRELVADDCATRWSERVAESPGFLLFDPDPPLLRAYDAACDLINALKEEDEEAGGVEVLLFLAWTVAEELHGRLHP